MFDSKRLCMLRRIETIFPSFPTNMWEYGRTGSSSNLKGTVFSFDFHPLNRYLLDISQAMCDKHAEYGLKFGLGESMPNHTI